MWHKREAILNRLRLGGGAKGQRDDRVQANRRSENQNGGGIKTKKHRFNKSINRKPINRKSKSKNIKYKYKKSRKSRKSRK